MPGVAVGVMLGDGCRDVCCDELTVLGDAECRFVTDGFQTGTALRIEALRGASAPFVGGVTSPPSVGLSGGDMRDDGVGLYLGGLGMTGTGSGGV